MEISAILVGAGKGKRMGGVNKVMLNLGRKPLFNYSLEVISSIPQVREIILVLNKEVMKDFPKIKNIILVEGGEERSISVKNGVNKSQYPYVLIHDVARPFISRNFLKSIIDSFSENVKGVIPGIPVKSTVKLAKKGIVYKTLNRKELYEIQTPQFFERSALIEAYRKLNIVDATDESFLLELIDYPVMLVEGMEENIKITTPFDLVIAERIIEKWNTE